MILGFAHITRNIGHGVIGVDVESAPEKWPLMAHRAKSHQLLMRQRQPGRPLEEFIRYDTGIARGYPVGRLYVNYKGRIVLGAHDVDLETAFFRDGLGFVREADGTLERLSQVPNWRVSMVVREDSLSPIDPPLDISYYAALAFYSSDVEADRDHLLKHGGRTPTEPFTVKLDREMKIVMLRSPEGTIIELIQVLK